MHAVRIPLCAALVLSSAAMSGCFNPGAVVQQATAAGAGSDDGGDGGDGNGDGDGDGDDDDDGASAETGSDPAPETDSGPGDGVDTGNEPNEGTTGSDDASESTSDGESTTTDEESTTGVEACQGLRETTWVEFADLACDGADPWSCPAVAPGCDLISCEDPIVASSGWVRTPGSVVAEGVLNYEAAIEIGPPQLAGSSTSANFYFDLVDVCSPVFRTTVACGYQQGCDGEFLVRIENLGDPDDFYEQLDPEGYDEDDSVVEIDLSPWQGQSVVVILGFLNGDDATAQDIAVFGRPRIDVTD